MDRASSCRCADPKDCRGTLGARTVALFWRARQRVFAPGDTSREKVASPRRSVIALGDRLGVDRGVATRAFRQAFRARGCCKQGRLRAVYSNLSALLRGSGTNESRSLAVIWFYATRLETRTKESDMCASLRVTETLGRNESESRSDWPK